MKVYISRKQAGVIYRNVKQGNIEMSKDAIALMYEAVDSLDGYYKGSVLGNAVELLLMAVDAIFANNFDGAQACINQAYAA